MSAVPSDPLLIVGADGMPIATTDVQSHAAAVSELVAAAAGEGTRQEVKRRVGEIQARLGPVFPVVAMEALVFLGHDAVQAMAAQLRRVGVSAEDTAVEIEKRRARRAMPNKPGGE
ncbi:hypothetical protein [Rhodococcus sp. SGAir0479]|uniref:hypothetical protein n=1 Tax=Rhodococcus sp. SGAir0479 TaxID=2567884 RepID=UPI0010CD6816|nr:hypothetical protein [Rhodococcus sp. SGAir0479]QCQ93038.1 hypothetical protein E7742_18640 [Rhodococcus sp. SGAir0479]